jgi:hypothetical protein
MIVETLPQKSLPEISGVDEVSSRTPRYKTKRAPHVLFKMLPETRDILLSVVTMVVDDRDGVNDANYSKDLSSLSVGIPAIPPTIQYHAGNAHKQAYHRDRYRSGEAFGRDSLRSDADVD